jgi:hypothetical protein
MKSSKSDNTDASLRGVASIIPFNPETPPPPPPKDSPRSIPISPDPSPARIESELLHRDNFADSDWDVVGHDDLPLRWATDYVALATPASRLANQSVLFFELHRCTDGGRVTARLAVATKQNILLYESVRGERAFRFVKVRIDRKSHDLSCNISLAIGILYSHPCTKCEVYLSKSAGGLDEIAFSCGHLAIATLLDILIRITGSELVQFDVSSCVVV